eukprot:NODE_3050_length_1061_cov_9.063241_g2801_i0.p1 GENE.NODE_3050_length_1061_cov_9.063241_g2801_i0~~NODE_3050_length_1061_cov_9.063241_g2801_i0.p1  ORF type:complete len:314 (+),score=40.54 NODE_3050_length_1061_cov_9.063241_g2801_i0:58-942(+)
MEISIHHHLLLFVCFCVEAAMGLHCAFIHGSGVKVEKPSIETSFPSYWGKVHELTPACTTRSFLISNTVKTNWSDSTLLSGSCAAAQGPVITNTAVFSHSMGNLIFAEALRTGTCSLGKGSFWFTTAAVWGGAAAASDLEAYCNGSRPLSRIVRVIADELGYCQGASASPAYRSMEPENPRLRSLLPIAKTATGAICGTSALGIPSIYSAPLDAIQSIAHLDKPNDGMVSLEHCQLANPHAPWQGNASSLFMTGRLNHADSTCRDGDRAHYADQQPCSWYRNMAQRAADALQML